MAILITGATGRLGRATMALLEKSGAPVRVLTRRLVRAHALFGSFAEVHEWHPQTYDPPPAAFDGVEMVVNLMGEPVAGRWTADKFKRVRDSRVGPTGRLARAIQGRGIHLINASSFGIYPGRAGEAYDERSAISAFDTPVQAMIRDWEQAALGARAEGTRVSVVRLGMLAGPEAYPSRLLADCQAGRAVLHGDGGQIVPLIDIEDAARLLLWVATEPDADGVINAVAPERTDLNAIAEQCAAVAGKGVRARLPDWLSRSVIGPSAHFTLGSFDIAPAVATVAGFSFAHATPGAILSRAFGVPVDPDRPPPASLDPQHPDLSPRPEPPRSGEPPPLKVRIG